MRGAKAEPGRGHQLGALPIIIVLVRREEVEAIARSDGYEVALRVVGMV